VKVKVLFFGILMSESGKQGIEVKDVKTISELKDRLVKEYPKFSTYQYQIFVNQEQIKGNQSLNSNDEIALIPPFAGG
jgi:molybdopterin converting factor small subunit